MYYQQQTTTTTSASKWNGNAWVQSNASNNNSHSSCTTYSNQAATAPTASNVGGGVPSMFSQTKANNASSVPTNQPSPALTVQQQQQAINQYAEYHKHWLAQSKTQRAKADMLRPGLDRDELIRHAAWAEHYAMLSTQAIQYYKSLSFGKAGFSVGAVQPQPLYVSTQGAKHVASQKQQLLGRTGAVVQQQPLSALTKESKHTAAKKATASIQTYQNPSE